jgi:plasmid replication initiation protein
MNGYFESTTQTRVIESIDFEDYFSALVDGVERIVYKLEGESYWVRS